jgi:SAM-dependent methyltransferase
MAAPLRAPPPKILSRAGGAEHLALEGKMDALDVYAAAVPALEMDRPLRILDFGCGYGRLLGFLGEAAPRSTVHAADPDGDAIAWCREAYRDEVRWGRFAFIDVGGGPPLSLRADYFDLVCGLSVFEGMPERQQLRWLSELRRVTRPEGFLVLSGLAVSPGTYFTVLEQIRSPGAGHRDLVLCMKHPALVL